MITEDRDLRTGRSIWESGQAIDVPYGPLAEDIETDVLVIGAGITGAMVTDALAASGLTVAIVDKRGPAKGSTTASTALVQFEIDTPLVALTKKIGEKDAVRAWRRSRQAVDALAARLRELGIPDVVQRDSLYLAGDTLDKDGLAREHAARHAAGLAGSYLDRPALRERFGIARGAALLTYGDYVIDPRQTTLALLEMARAQHRTPIFAPVEIVDLDVSRKGAIARAANGRGVHCRHIVFATGYELLRGIPHRGHKITSTWATATVAQPQRLWPGQCSIWEASDPYLYLRTTPDGRVVCGGEDEDFSDEAARDALLECKTETLRRKLGDVFPGLDTKIEFAWTGSFGQTTTGLPIIGQVPGLPNCWAALGYGGNGISYARIAADVIAGALTGRPDVDADLYDFPA